MKRQRVRFLLLGVLLLLPLVAFKQVAAQHGPRTAALRFVQQAARGPSADPSPPAPEDAQLAPITIDYPAEGSIFPPDITAPTFLWRDAAEEALVWRIDVAFTDSAAGIEVTSQGERLRVGEIDPRCISPNNELPKLTAQQAASHIWTPDAATWEAIKKRSVERPATITITGFRATPLGQAVSRGRVVIKTSSDPVGAPIFYRDVPLMPSELEKGVIKPLPAFAISLIGWRLRYVDQPRSELVLSNMHTCANCHSFSLDGKTMGMDLDGPQNDKGLYAIVPVKPHMSMRNQDVISWSALQDETMRKERIGFMSQVSPDGRYVITMVRGLEREIAGGYYVVNFKDYRFLQVFYPTRGIVAWYNRATGRIKALPGADDPRYVQTSPVWSPDGKYVVFARAEAKDPYVKGQHLAEHANDPEETQIEYDLCRIPFNDGEGGKAELIEGASRNGMSNTFPKVSPDGRWIVFVKCRNGQLMRPDSQLYIVPAEGGQARKMRCNTPLMNSWHSFSPNGRWLVFSSKSRSPYTQMFLTHLDQQGNDSPPILIENATAANRAVNIPEFVNIPRGSLIKIDAPAAESYRLDDEAVELIAKGEVEAAIVVCKNALELDPRDAKANSNLGVALLRKGSLNEGMKYFRNALEITPELGEAHNNLGIALLQKGQLDTAIMHFQKALELNPAYARTYEAMLSSLEGSANRPPVLLRLEDAEHPTAQDVAFEKSRQKREKLEAEYRRSLDAVISRILASAGPGRTSAMHPEEWPNLPTAGGAQAGILRAPNPSAELDQLGSQDTQIQTLIAGLEIPRLRKLAEENNTDDGLAAQQQILRIFFRTFECGTAALERNMNTQSLMCFGIAAQAAPNNPYILYSLARGQALNKQKRNALKSLEKAAEKGFKNIDQVEGDQAFEDVRGDSDYRKIVAKMRTAKPQTESDP